MSAGLQNLSQLVDKSQGIVQIVLNETSISSLLLTGKPRGKMVFWFRVSQRAVRDRVGWGDPRVGASVLTTHSKQCLFSVEPREPKKKEAHKFYGFLWTTPKCALFKPQRTIIFSRGGDQGLDRGTQDLCVINL